MIIETWVFVLILFAFAAIGFFSLVVASRVSVLLEEEREKSYRLSKENKELTRRLAHRNALDNIKVANDYYIEQENK
jgi:hypothetical protein